MVVEIITSYLLSNRKLVVPTLGAFIVKESGERLFSDLLREDDGVLTSLLREKGLSEMEAAVTLERFIFAVRHDLEKYGYYQLGEMGTLRLEPVTKVLRLYPPVYSNQELAIEHTPYIPQPVEEEVVNDDKVEETVDEPIVEEVKNETLAEKQDEAPIKKEGGKAAKSRKKVDVVMVLAFAIVAAALLAIGYGLYVSML